jgi:hypothetical protein
MFYPYREVGASVWCNKRGNRWWYKGSFAVTSSDRNSGIMDAGYRSRRVGIRYRISL